MVMKIVGAAEEKILFFPEVDAVEGLSTALYDAIDMYRERLTVIEVLGLLRLLSDEISEEARSDD